MPRNTRDSAPQSDSTQTTLPAVRAGQRLQNKAVSTVKLAIIQPGRFECRVAFDAPLGRSGRSSFISTAILADAYRVVR